MHTTQYMHHIDKNHFFTLHTGATLSMMTRSEHDLSSRLTLTSLFPNACDGGARTDWDASYSSIYKQRSLGYKMKNRLLQSQALFLRLSAGWIKLHRTLSRQASRPDVLRDHGAGILSMVMLGRV